MGFRDEDETTDTGVRGAGRVARPKVLARVVVLGGGPVGREYVLEKEATIGRSSDCTICIDDPQVSRRHTAIHRGSSGAFVITDLDSRNGTLVNGTAIDSHALSFGDRIQVGSAALLLFTHQDPLEDQLLQRQKLETVGRLGAGIAHDFNNLLGAGMSCLDYLDALPRTSPLGDADVKECMMDMRSALTRAAELTNRLLGFSRRGTAAHGAVDITALCVDVMALVTRTFGRSIELSADVQPNLVVHGHAGELHQVLMNLCLNARDAMPEGGKLVLSGRAVDASQVAETVLVSPGPHIELAVCDTGTGMDDLTRKHVFEPFFTTKDELSGAGLGLATVYEVAVAHGGSVGVESEPGAGTVFRVFLPATDPSTMPTSRRADTTSQPITIAEPGYYRTGRVLVVDDETLVRRSLVRLLKYAGHEVEQAEDGRVAVELFRAAEHRPELVLLDLDMPEMDGVTTFGHLLEMDPEVRVICVSGHWDEERKRQLEDMGVIELVGKPYDARDLLKKVSQSLP